MDEEQPTPEPAPAPDPASPRRRRRRRLQLAVVLTLAAAVVLLLGLQVSGIARIFPESATGPAKPLSLRIALVDASGAVVTMDERGGSVVRHPVDGVAFQFPAWSPDGTRVAAIASSIGAGSIYVFQARDAAAADVATATEPTVIYKSPDRPPFYLYWSPDSSRVTFLTQEPEALAMRVAPADASSPASVLRQGAPLYWDWVDPALALVNVGAGSADGFLGEVGLDGTAHEPTAKASAFRSPAMTADGSHRAYVVDTGGGAGSIVVESHDGSNRHEIAVPGLAAFSFAGAGTSLAYIAPDAPNSQPADLPIGSLRVVDVASGAVRTIQEGDLVAFFWSPDGRTIATLRIPAPGENEVASLGTRLPPVAVGSGYDVSLAFVDVATGEVRSKKRVRITNLFGLQVLPFFDQYARSHRVWSRDSASIVLPLVSAEGVDGVVVLPADGSAERRLSDGEMGFWSP
jgi:TolB protein